MVIVNLPTSRGFPGGWTAALLFFAGAGLVCAEDAQLKIFAARADAEFHRAQVQSQSHPNDPAAAQRFARACFDRADFATNGAERATLAELGITASRQCVAHDPKDAAGHYDLALNLGQLARTETLGALKLVKEMEREFKKADDLDEHFDQAGPARCLGLLYRDAPGWPTSIGSRRKAREWLERAVKLAPEDPENLLNLAESRLKWSDRPGAESALQALDALWPNAQTKLAGEAWERYWYDWSARRVATRLQIQAASPSPRPPENGH